MTIIGKGMFNRSKNIETQLTIQRQPQAGFSDTGNHATTVNIKVAGHHDLSQCIPQQDKYITSIIVSSPGSLIESYMEIGFSLKGGATDYVRLTDYLLNPSVSVINLTEYPVVIKPNLIITFDSQSDANLFITFVSKDDLEERLEMFSRLLKAYYIINRKKTNY